ncbi:MAG TPA: transposase [Thiobacillaceae bacterium]|nr:transposase [Thiobacillaceae bacterium]
MLTDSHALIFITLVHYQRQPLSRDGEDKRVLLRIMREVKDRFHLRVAGYAILHDHLHWLFTKDGAQPAAVVNDLKAQYARVYRERHPEFLTAPLWNGGFKFQDVDTSEEIRSLLDLMHYDPVRHGYVNRPVDYEWTSFPARVLQGHYREDWGSEAPPPRLASLPMLRRQREAGLLKALGQAPALTPGAGQ